MKYCISYIEALIARRDRRSSLLHRTRYLILHVMHGILDSMVALKIASVR